MCRSLFVSKMCKSWVRDIALGDELAASICLDEVSHDHKAKAFTSAPSTHGGC